MVETRNMTTPRIKATVPMRNKGRSYSVFVCISRSQSSFIFYTFGKILKFVWGLGTIQVLQMLMHVDGERKFNRYLDKVRDSSSHRTRKKIIGTCSFAIIAFLFLYFLLLAGSGL